MYFLVNYLTRRQRFAASFCSTLPTEKPDTGSFALRTDSDWMLSWGGGISGECCVSLHTEYGGKERMRATVVNVLNLVHIQFVGNLLLSFNV